MFYNKNARKAINAIRVINAIENSYNPGIFTALVLILISICLCKYGLLPKYFNVNLKLDIVFIIKSAVSTLILYFINTQAQVACVNKISDVRASTKGYIEDAINIYSIRIFFQTFLWIGLTYSELFKPY